MAGRRAAGRKVTSFPRASVASRSQFAIAEDEQCSSFPTAIAALTNENAYQQRSDIKFSEKDKSNSFRCVYDIRKTVFYFSINMKQKINIRSILMIIINRYHLICDVHEISCTIIVCFHSIRLEVNVSVLTYVLYKTFTFVPNK